MILENKLAEVGIRISGGFQQGRTYKTLCPQCSATRKSKNDRCLSVTIGPAHTKSGEVKPGDAVWNCHNCAWASGCSENDRPEPQYKNRRGPPKKPKPLPNDALPQPVIEWFARRGIGRSVLERNRIKLVKVWMPGCEDGETVWAMAFPYYRDGELINVKYRTVDKRFRQEKDAEKIYYGLDDVPPDATEIIIVEGEMDKLSYNEAGIWNVVSVPDGAPKQVQEEAFKSETDVKFEYVWNCESHFLGKTIVSSTDADGPGQALAEELARRYGKHRCKRVQYPIAGDVTAKDANEVLVEHGPEVLAEIYRDAKPYPINSIFFAHDFADDVLAFYSGETDPMFSTGWRAVDELYKVRAGEVTVVTGFPNSGKSEWIDALMVNLSHANPGWSHGVCSFENPPKNHIAKLVEKHNLLPFHDGLTHRMTLKELESAMQWVDEHFYFIRCEDEEPTIDWILDKAQSLVFRYGIRDLIIDPYNEIEHKRASNMTETEYVSQILSKVRRFAENYGVHIWIVAHPAKLRRDAQGNFPKPSLYDISGSAHWVNKPDVGIVIWRDMSIVSADVTVMVKKMRWKEVGMVGEAILRYHKVNGTYADQY